MGFETKRPGIRVDDAVRQMVVKRGKQAIKTGPVYSTITPAVCYHASPTCPVMKGGGRWRNATRRATYASADEAFAAGHLRPCERCVSSLYARLDGGRSVQLTFEQADTLAVISRLQRLRKAVPGAPSGLSHGEVAAGRGVHAGTVYVIVRALAKMGLVEKTYTTENRARAANRSISITAEGQKVLESLPRQ